jgi:hypothetical protein
VVLEVNAGWWALIFLVLFVAEELISKWIDAWREKNKTGR